MSVAPLLNSHAAAAAKDNRPHPEIAPGVFYRFPRFKDASWNCFDRHRQRYQQFDVLHIADLRFPGGTSSAIAHEIRALHGAGLSVGLVQKRAQVLRQDRPLNPKIQEQIDLGAARLVEVGEVRAQLAVIHNPYVCETLEPTTPRIVCERAVMVAHQPVVDGNGLPYYDVATIQKNATALVGRAPVWAPISPISRENLAERAYGLEILEEDWTNLVFVEDWKDAEPKTIGDRPVMGRHSRPDWAKWPASAHDLFTIYPDDPAYDVRLLGVGQGLDDLLKGAPKPANWRTWAFNEIEVSDFLRELDFFVYFHHPDWVEGFGRTIAEAMAAGKVVILPEHFRRTFGEAALYRAPAEVRATIDELFADRETLALQGRMGQRWIDRHYGPKRYLDRVVRLLARPGSADAPEAGATNVEAAAPSSKNDAYDVVHLGDFRTLRETALRVAHSARIEHDAGYRAALVHYASLGSKDLDCINPEIDALARDGAAEPVDPARGRILTRLLTIHQPDLVYDHLDAETAAPRETLRIEAERVVVIHDRGMDLKAIARRNALFATLFGPVIWAATTVERRAELEKVPGLRLDAGLWSVSVHCRPWAGPSERNRSQTVIGRIARNDPADWPKDEAEARRAWGPSASACVRMFGWPKLTKLPYGALPPHWELFRLGEMSLRRFIGGLDAIVHLTSGERRDPDLHVLADAMAHGVPVIASRDVAERLDRAPKSTSPAEAERLLRAMESDRAIIEAMAVDQARKARQAFGDGVHRRRLQRLIGAAKIRAPRVNLGARRRMLFVSSNGVGLGHLTRLLAVARRMPADVEPTFLTMSQALPIVRQCGYPVEYLPFHVYANCDPAAWNPWFADQLGQVIDFHRAETVVFDGGNPYQGLLDAMARRTEAKLVWVRRGMWREHQNNETAIRRQRFFDLIVEPAEIASAADRGATTKNSAFATQVAPIRLLDDDEILSKEAACAEIGLDPKRPSCLIQLGSGSNRDIVSMIDTVLDRVSRVEGMQPVIAEWMISPNALDFWPGVKRLRGFPLSRYFNAFDFTVSAAGYNSFNEIVSFGLPAIFMANDHAMMDDQGGRARFAQDNDAAFHLPDHHPEAVGPLVSKLLDPELRTIMKANCQRISLGNGARDAADAVAAA